MKNYILQKSKIYAEAARLYILYGELRRMAGVEYTTNMNRIKKRVIAYSYDRQ